MSKRSAILIAIAAVALLIAGCGSTGWGNSLAAEQAREAFRAKCSHDEGVSPQQCRCVLHKLESEFPISRLSALEANIAVGIESYSQAKSTVYAADHRATKGC